jgi:hypothetical protein
VAVSFIGRGNQIPGENHRRIITLIFINFKRANITQKKIYFCVPVREEISNWRVPLLGRCYDKRAKNIEELRHCATLAEKAISSNTVNTISQTVLEEIKSKRCCLSLNRFLNNVIKLSKFAF